MITFCSSGQVFLLLPYHLCFLPDQLWWLAHRLFNENPCSFMHTWFLWCKSASPLILYLLFLYPLFLSFSCLCYDFLYNAIQYPCDPDQLLLPLMELAALLCLLGCLPVSAFCFSTSIAQWAVFSLILCSLHEWLLFFSMSLCFKSSFSSGIYSSWIFHDVLSFLLLHVLKSPLNTWFYVPMATATSDSVTKARTELILPCFSCLPHHVKMGEPIFLIWWLITLQ